MEISQYALATMLLCALVCGLALGAAYDILRLCRGQLACRCIGRPLPQRLKPIIWPTLSWQKYTWYRVLKIVLLAIGDALFCLFCGVVLILVLYATNGGQFRISAVVIAAIGFGIYMLTLGRLIRPVLAFLLSFLRTWLIWNSALIVYPISMFFHFLWRKSRRWRETKRAQMRRRREERAQKKAARLSQAKDTKQQQRPNDSHNFSRGAHRVT